MLYGVSMYVIDWTETGEAKVFCETNECDGFVLPSCPFLLSIFLREEVSNTWRLLQIKPMSYEQVFINFEHEYNARLQELDDAMRVFETENIVGIYREKNQTERELYNKLLLDVKRASNKLRDNKSQAVLLDTKYSEMEGELEALRKLKTSADKTLIMNVMRRVKKLRQERVVRQTQTDNLSEQLLSEHFQLRSSLLAETQGVAQKQEEKGVVLKMMGYAGLVASGAISVSRNAGQIGLGAFASSSMELVANASQGYSSSVLPLAIAGGLIMYGVRGLLKSIPASPPSPSNVEEILKPSPRQTSIDDLVENTEALTISPTRPRKCSNGNCQSPVEGKLKTCESCLTRKKHWRLKTSSLNPKHCFEGEQIVSQKPPYQHDFISALFIGSTSSGKSVATSALIQTICNLMPTRYYKEFTYCYTTKPDENGWSEPIYKSNLFETIDNLEDIYKQDAPCKKLLIFDDIGEMLETSQQKTLSKLFTAGRGRKNSYGLDVVMLIHEMFASRTNGKFIRQNVKFIFVFAGANYEKIADTYCRSYGGKKKGQDYLSSIINKSTNTCAVIDLFKRDYIQNVKINQYIFPWQPPHIETTDLHLPSINDGEWIDES